MRQQLVLAMLLAAGTFLPLGIGKDADARILLLYPIISVCLVSAWEHNGTTLSVTADYIRRCIETYDCSIGWEAYLDRRFGTSSIFGLTEFASTVVLALVTQLVAIVYAWPMNSAEAIETTLAIIAVESTYFTIWISWNAYNQRKNVLSRPSQEMCRDVSETIVTTSSI